jgi:excisionase family DNA binding protein
MNRSAPSAPLIGIDEAAARLGVTPRFIRRLVDERRIPFHKIGKFVRFDPADVDNYIRRGRVEPASS